jgi:hypothetical protein
MIFNKPLFSPRSKNKARSSTALNVRRFSTDSVFNSQPVKFDHSTAVGRRLSKDASSFLTSSPPDINSRRSSYLDIISSGNKLSGKSPVLSIENVSDSSSRSNEPLRKLSDSESIGRKLATSVQAPEPAKRNKLGEQSRSLDGNPGKSRKKRDAELPPAPPPPNCSPRNSNGRSPLERLSKDELVLLWRSSESELRSHLLKAIRDKEEPVEPP